jgi:hypothetical protein
MYEILIHLVPKQSFTAYSFSGSAIVYYQQLTNKILYRGERNENFLHDFVIELTRWGIVNPQIIFL